MTIDVAVDDPHGWKEVALYSGIALVSFGEVDRLFPSMIRFLSVECEFADAFSLSLPCPRADGQH